MKEIQKPSFQSASPPTKRPFNSYPIPSVSFLSKPSPPSADNELTREDSFKQLYPHNISLSQDLYKVTEFNESMEYSVSICQEQTTKKSDTKNFESIVDKFPKFSLASLCISDCSINHQPADTRKTENEYIENLEVVLFSEKEEPAEMLENRDTLQATKGSIEGDLDLKEEPNRCECRFCRIM